MIATLQPTRFGKNQWHTVSMCDFCKLQSYEHRIKIASRMSDCCDLIFLGACLAILRRLNLAWILRRVSDLRDLRKKKGKMSILAANCRPSKCGLRDTSNFLITTLKNDQVVSFSEFNSFPKVDENHFNTGFPSICQQKNSLLFPYLNLLKTNLSSSHLKYTKL